MSERSIYSIGALAWMLGLSPATLRSWEERYGVVIPERSSGSQRLYSRDNLDQLRFVREQMQHGLSAADAHRALAERLALDLQLDAEQREPGERRILLVERDPYAAELAEYFLRTEGYDVHVVRSIADAEQVVRDQSLDLAIVDLMIGGGAGLALCDELSASIPVLAVSALDQHDRVLAVGAQAFIRKPFDSLGLVSATRDLVGTSAIVRTANRVRRGMIERIPSGHDRLDALLGGGLPANGINLIIGHPGTGKTILAEQYLFRNATAERRGVYLSTMSEPFDKILRYGEALSFFDTDAIGSSIFFDDLGEAVNRDGLPGVIAQIDILLKEQQPSYVVVDSFKALRAFAVDEAQFRRFLHDLAGRLTAVAASAFWIGEYDRNQAAEAPEFAVADTIIALHVNRTAERELRVLQVLKLRGSGFHTGEHAYRIGPDGLNVFPRLADEFENSSYTLGAERVSTGIPALDETIGDGYWPGAVTLIVGPTGAGKTLMALHFLFHGAENGEPGVLATFQENSTQLDRIAKGFGWDFASSKVVVLGRSPVDLYVDEWVYDLLECVERTQARRVVIDSLGDLLFVSPDEVRFRELMYSLAQRLSRRGVSLLMTHESVELFRVTRLSEIGISHLSDNVVVLQYLRADSEVKRVLLVLKTRASEHHPEIREFKIRPEGIVLGEKFHMDQRFD